MLLKRLLFGVSLLAACHTSPRGKLTDAGASGDAASAECPGLIADYQRYITDHQACSKDEDCSVLDGCDCPDDWAAVRGDAYTAAQDLRNDVFHLHGCPSSNQCDGPVYGVSCVSGRCTLGGAVGQCGLAPHLAYLEISPSPWSTGQAVDVRPSLLVSGWTSDRAVFEGTLQLRTYPGDVLVPTQSHLDALPDDAGTMATGSSSDSFTYRLTPAQPLETGWYVLRLSLPASTAAQIAHAPLPSDGTYVSYFRVGSTPYLLAVEALPSTSTALFPKLMLTFSEAVHVPDPLPIAVTADGVATSCKINDPSLKAYETLQLRCDPPVPATAIERVSISEGITSALDRTALRNAAGQTRFSVELGHDAGRWLWSEPSTKPPSF